MLHRSLFLVLALPALAFAGDKTSYEAVRTETADYGFTAEDAAVEEVSFELTRTEAAAVEADIRALSRLRAPTTDDLPDATAALVDELFLAMDDEVSHTEIHVQLWPPVLAICGPKEGGYQTCCQVSPHLAYCNNASSD